MFTQFKQSKLKLMRTIKLLSKKAQRVRPKKKTKK